MASCNACKKRVLPHSYRMICSSCKDLVHLKCLPSVSKTDSVYTQRETNVWFCPSCTEGMFPFNHIYDEDEFMVTLADNWNSQNTLPFECLNSQDKIFCPFDLNEDTNTLLHEADPDMNYYRNNCNYALQSCDYYLEDSFNKKIGNLNITNACLSMVHTNIRSAVRNLGKFETYLSTLDQVFTIIALSESWLKDRNVDLYGIPGYNAEHRFRPLRSGGGVSLLIKESVEYFVREDMTFQNNNMESLLIEINKDQIGKQYNIIVEVIYRPPDTEITIFNEYMNRILTQSKSERNSSYILGDFNINLLNVDKHLATQEFVDIM